MENRKVEGVLTNEPVADTSWSAVIAAIKSNCCYRVDPLMLTILRNIGFECPAQTEIKKQRRGSKEVKFLVYKC
jgi:hypothetical protein